MVPNKLKHDGIEKHLSTESVFRQFWDYVVYSALPVSVFIFKLNIYENFYCFCKIKNL